MTKTMTTQGIAIQWEANYAQSVEKHLVHKAFNSEVFLTDSHKLDENTFEIAAFLPRSHIYYNDTQDFTRHDVSALLEVFRQCSIFVAHNFYGVALSSKFIFDSADFKVLHNEVLENSPQSYQAIITIAVLQVKHKRGNDYGLLLDMRLFIDSKKYATKIMDMSWFAPKMYERLRGEIANENYTSLDNHQIPPKSLGQNAITNVVITQFLQESQYFQTTIIPNQAHPAFFDHPLDHLPASLLIEAIRQSSLYALTNLSSCKQDMQEIITKHLLSVSKSEKFDLFVVLDSIVLEINAKLLGLDCKVYEATLKPLSKTIQLADSKHTDKLIQDFTQMYDFILEFLQNTQSLKTEGIIAKFIKNKNATNPHLSDKELCGLLLGSILGGYQNILTFISKMLYALLYFPQFWNLLLIKRNLCENMLYEFLRLTNLGTTSTFPRITTANIRLSKYEIPKDSVVYADVLLANRDPLVFANPTQINPFRLNNKQHLQFGRGAHSCMGQHLLQLESLLILNAILDILPHIQLDSSIAIKWDSGVILHRPQSIPVINQSKTPNT